jgi:Zn-dependent protease
MSVTFGTAYTATSVGLNVLATIMITIRLVLHRQLILNTLPPEHATHYVSVATIVIESAALYSIFALGFMVSYAIKNPLSQIFMALASVCQVCVSLY